MSSPAQDLQPDYTILVVNTIASDLMQAQRASSALESFSTKARKAWHLAVTKVRVRLGYQECVEDRVEKNIKMGPRSPRRTKGKSETNGPEWRRAACTCTLTCARTDAQQVGRFSRSRYKENEMRLSGPPSKVVATCRQ